MHLSMLSLRKGVGHAVGIWTFSLKKIQIPHPQDKLIGQNPHPVASEGVKCPSYDQNRYPGIGAKYWDIFPRVKTMR